MSPPRSRRATWILVASALVIVGLVATATVVSLRGDGTVAYRIYGRLGEKLVRNGVRAARTPS